MPSRLPMSCLRQFTFGVMVLLSLCCLPLWSQEVSTELPSPVSSDETEIGDSVSERLRLVEEQNRRLTERLEQLAKEHEEQIGRLVERLEKSATNSVFQEGGQPYDAVATAGFVTASEVDSHSPVPDYTEGMFSPLTSAPGFPESSSRSSSRSPLYASFGPGFQLKTKDDQFSLQIHYESQIEGRVWDPSREDPGNSGFYLPRQRFFFTGNMTKNIEYEISINRGLNNINLLNAYLNFHFNDRFEIRVGRFFTPFLYDQYAISNYWLLTPERSLFTTNLSLNRQIGAMAWGYLLDKQVDYAAGVFNGSRNSFESLNNSVDFVGYLNTRPFQKSDAVPAARFLNLGTSFAFGYQNQAPSPATFRIGAGSPDTAIPSTATTPFLILNPGVVERGDRALGSVHLAYFYKSLSLISELQYGYGGYASNVNPASASVPFSGYYVSGGYFLTGEEVERRTRVKPLRSLIPLDKNEAAGPGAWELAGRVSQLRVGNDIFDSGLADPSIWSNSATTTELGVNWYWNDYLKFYAFWLHGEFGDPVQIRPGELRKSVDMLWLRSQLYF